MVCAGRFRSWSFFALTLTAVSAFCVREAAAGSGNILPGIFSTILQGAIVENARKSWLAVDVDVRNCLASRYSISADALYQQGITATDNRVTPYIQACQQAIAQAREQQEEQLRAQEQQREAAEEDAARQRAEALRQQQQAEQAQKAAQEAAEAQKKARHDSLVAKFGSKMADNVLSGTVVRGMTADEVEATLGPPLRKEPFPPDAELWSYNSQRIGFYKGHVSHIGQ